MIFAAMDMEEMEKELSYFSIELLHYISRASWLGAINVPKLGKFTPYDMSALLKACGEKHITKAELKTLWGTAMRFCIPAMDLTMAKMEVSVSRDADSVIFQPTARPFQYMAGVEQIYLQECRYANLVDTLYGYSARSIGNPVTRDDLIATMLINFFRVFAKKRIMYLNATEDLCSLQETEINMIVSLMRDSTDVTDIIIQTPNRSFAKLKEALVPILARNRILVENKYRPALTGDHWLEAGFYWLRYLSDETNQDLLNFPLLAKHDKYKSSTREMGTEGLHAILRCLKDRKARIQMMYGPSKPAFYVSCLPNELDSYLTELVTYVKTKDAYFPFNSLGIAYEPGYDRQFIDLISTLGIKPGFDKIVLTNFVPHHKGKTSELIEQLIAIVKQGKWCSLVQIPELEDPSTLNTDEYKALHEQYARLNNLILKNRRVIQADILVQRTKAIPAVKIKADEAGADVSEAAEVPTEEKEAEAEARRTVIGRS